MREAGKTQSEPRQMTPIYVDYLIWDDWNIEHVAQHNVTPEEVQRICYTGRSLVRRAGTTRYGLWRYHVYGQSENGRYLFIVLDQEAEGTFYVVTARDMSPREKRLFRKNAG